MTIRIHPSWCCWLANRYPISSRTGRARSDFTISSSASAARPSLQYPLASCHWRCHRSRRHRSTSGAWSASKYVSKVKGDDFSQTQLTIMPLRYHLQQYAILMRKSCDVTDVVRTFRKSTNAGRDDALILIKTQKISLAGLGLFTPQGRAA